MTDKVVVADNLKTTILQQRPKQTNKTKWQQNRQKKHSADGFIHRGEESRMSMLKLILYQINIIVDY